MGVHKSRDPLAQQPGMTIIKAGDVPQGEGAGSGQTVNWTYTVENTGNTTQTGIAVTDSRGVQVACPATELAPGDSMTCTGSGAVAPMGQG